MKTSDLNLLIILVMDLLGGVNEHAAFLLMRAHEMQGEIQEAFCYAITYQSLDPEVI